MGASNSIQNINFTYHPTKALGVLGYILSELGGKTDFHKIFKIIYFADQRHLVDYGRPITGDYFVAMNNGPVPSNIYDVFKRMRKNISDPSDVFHEYFYAEGQYYIVLKSKPDATFLSKSDIECLDISIKENKDLDFNALTRKSHDNAYNSSDHNSEINFYYIAQAGGANEDTLKYISTISENQAIKL